MGVKDLTHELHETAQTFERRATQLDRALVAHPGGQLHVLGHPALALREHPHGAQVLRVDPDVDLAAQRLTLAHSPWITSLLEPLPPVPR